LTLIEQIRGDKTNDVNVTYRWLTIANTSREH
jgi:hypothetical protein